MPSFRINMQWAAISEVIPNLYISGVTALKPQELAAIGIDMIVNCTSEVPNLKDQSIHRVKLWLQDTDTENLQAHLDTVTEQMHMIHKPGGRVLVHCVAGVSRSAAVMLAYLLRYHCRSLRFAYDLLASKRAMVRPNLGFWRQLIAYEELITGKPSSVRLVWTRQPSKHGAASTNEKTDRPPIDQSTFDIRRKDRSVTPSEERQLEDKGDVTLLPDVYLVLAMKGDVEDTSSVVKHHHGIDKENESLNRVRHPSAKFRPKLSTVCEGEHAAAVAITPMVTEMLMS